ncbi:hypothetical protein GCM10011511_37570 [Puia dinghuensis]|uniref:Uncharacterized protein n=1 Tax=Puia dinghuensis TaxID=1792502 RepID=A0A8J2XV68_9BACT|nr:hypothetical protein GCM10011511_37570 [Puia dinghuensis]
MPSVKKPVQDTPATNECVFDTSAYKFTTEKLKKYDKDISFIWDGKNYQAIVKFPGNDTLWLHIGGCVDFSYTAIYSTDSSRYSDSAYLLKKAGWLAKNFLGGGFDSKYAECLAKNLYTRRTDDADSNSRAYNIINEDTSVTNKIYEPFSFELRGARAVITIGGYEN